jgi:hypothetical protein
MAAATDCGFKIDSSPSPIFSRFSPSDFYLFLKLKTKLHGRCLEAMKMSWRLSVSSLGTKIESSILRVKQVGAQVGKVH